MTPHASSPSVPQPFPRRRWPEMAQGGRDKGTQATQPKGEEASVEDTPQEATTSTPGGGEPQETPPGSTSDTQSRPRPPQSLARRSERVWPD